MQHGFLSITVLASFLAMGCTSSQRSTDSDGTEPTSPKNVEASPQHVEAGCATCIFEMEGVAGCKLAVRIDGKPYLVTGSDIDDHGDAHAPDGLCHTARKAVVEGKIDGDHFVATRIELQP